MKPNPDHSYPRYGQLRRRVRCLHAYDIGNTRLAKGKLDPNSTSSLSDDSKGTRTPMIPTGKKLSTTTSTRSQRTFAELGLNWIEYYHKSDKIKLRTLDVSLLTGGNWNLTDIMPLSLDSLFPYVGQNNLDFADYEGLGMEVKKNDK